MNVLKFQKCRARIRVFWYEIKAGSGSKLFHKRNKIFFFLNLFLPELIVLIRPKPFLNTNYLNTLTAMKIPSLL